MMAPVDVLTQVLCLLSRSRAITLFVTIRDEELLGTRPRSLTPTEVELRADVASTVAIADQAVRGWAKPTDVLVTSGPKGAELRIKFDLTDLAETDHRDAHDALRRLSQLGEPTLDENVRDGRVRAFVLRFGSLFQPEYATGRRPRLRTPYGAEARLKQRLPYHPRGAVEPVVAYEDVGAAVYAVLRLAGRLRRGRPVVRGDIQLVHSALTRWDWATLPDATVAKARLQCERLLKENRELITFSEKLYAVPIGFVNAWLIAKDVRPYVTWQAGLGPRVVWTGQLWGHIGAQLLGFVRNGEHHAECDGCGAPVIRSRAPKAGQAAWCGGKACERLRVRQAKRLSRSSTRRAGPTRGRVRKP